MASVISTARRPSPALLSTTVSSLLAVLLLSSLLFFLLSSSSLTLSPSANPNRPCNYTSGSWVRLSSPRPRYDHTCKEIFKGWNCIANAKSNAPDLATWQWVPSDGCRLLPVDPRRFLEEFRGSSIGFVGDSLNRNMFASLICMLRSVSSDVRKWRPVGADRGFTFVAYNVTVAYHRTNLLVRYGSWSASDNGGALESLGYKKGYRVDVDIPDHTWARTPAYHNILIFNTGHWWWAPSKFDPVQSPMLFFEKGLPVLPPVSPEVGFDMALKCMISYIEKSSAAHVIKFFRTQSPRHFEGGDWYQGGSCRRTEPLSTNEVERLFSVENNGTNVEARVINRHLHKALQGSSFRILAITHISEFRADAHPCSTGGKKHDDCMHWCLPGLTDTWNDLLVANLKGLQR